MSIYYRNSGLSWSQYLQADSFVKDVTGEIKRSGTGISTAISTQTRDMTMAISDQTRDIMASNDALAREDF